MCKFTSYVTELFPLQSNMYFKYWSPLRLMFQRQFQVYTDNCLIILNYIIDVKHIEDTNYKQGNFFFLIFLFTESKLLVSKFAWQTLWKVLSFQESQQGPLFADPLAATLESSLLTSLHRPTWFEVLLSVATILLEYYCHPNKCPFCLQIQSNPSLLIMDFIHWWKPTRECCNWRLINCVVRFYYKCISGLPSFLWPRFPN
jgi:hypothetical protein